MLIFEVHNEDNSIFYMVQNMDIWIFKIYNEDNTILYKVYNREMLEFANLQILTDANYSTLIMKKNLYLSCTQSCLFLDFASIKTDIWHLTFPIKTNTIFYIMLHIESLTCENFQILHYAKYRHLHIWDSWWKQFDISHGAKYWNLHDGKFPSSALSKI